MKEAILVLTALCFNLLCFSQYYGKISPGDSIKGLCDPKQVYIDFILPNCAPAQFSLSDRKIEKRLNAEIPFFKDNAKVRDTGIVALLINCKGEIVKCEMDIKTKSILLDRQIMEVFNSLGPCTPAKNKGKNVDSVRYWNFIIKNGRIRHWVEFTL
jgi:hypothetical protein